MYENIRWVDRNNLDSVAIDRIIPCNVAIDIGTGIRPHEYVKSAYYICCEPYDEYVKILKDIVDEKYDKIYIVEQKTWAEALESYEDKSVDSVFLIDVIEHLNKTEVIELLRRTERLARKQIIIFTPLGFIEQHTLDGGKDAWGLDGAAWQEHKSGWTPEDFDSNWEIYACKDYHEFNNIGERLETPFGAFWAIRTFKETAENIYSDLHKKIFAATTLNNIRVNKHVKTLQEENKILNGQYSTLQQYHEELQHHLQEALLHNSTLQQYHEELQHHLQEALLHKSNLYEQYLKLDREHQKLQQQVLQRK
jgi:hypothetical protein